MLRHSTPAYLHLPSTSIYFMLAGWCKVQAEGGGARCKVQAALMPWSCKKTHLPLPREFRIEYRLQTPKHLPTPKEESRNTQRMPSLGMVMRYGLPTLVPSVSGRYPECPLSSKLFQTIRFRELSSPPPPPQAPEGRRRRRCQSRPRHQRQLLRAQPSSDH